MTTDATPLDLKNFFGSTHARKDFWAALAAMLVTLPAAIAFGVVIYSSIDPSQAATGALAGIVGTVVVGLVAAILGGTERMISAPCAPAAAILTAFTFDLVHQGVEAHTIMLLLSMLGILTGLMQMLFGFIGLGRLINYIPYPVASGFLSGVGLIIIVAQIPALLGTSAMEHWYQPLLRPWAWDLRSILVGGITLITGLLAPRFTRRIPATILAIAAGVISYFALAWFDASMLRLEHNALIIGPLGTGGQTHLTSLEARWQDLGQLPLSQILGLSGNALTLAVLLSVDTLKTSVMVDQVTRTRHDSNRELVAQGLANALASAVGGIPGAGTSGSTMVNLASGAQTRASSVMAALLALVAALVFGSLLAWLPVATLAGILLLIGLRMIDREPLRLIESRATVLDLVVVLAVIFAAIKFDLIVATLVGIGLVVLLFLREQIGGSVIHHKVYANQISSTWHRPEDERHILQQKGDQAVIFELRGSLFFGTAQKLFAHIEPELATRKYLILDFRRVLSMDVTAAQMLRNVRSILDERGGRLLLSSLAERLPNGRNLREFLEQTGVLESHLYLPAPSAPTVAPGETAQAPPPRSHLQSPSVLRFNELNDALEWVEDHLLGDLEDDTDDQPLMQLQEMELFQKRRDETLQDLEGRMTQRHFPAGSTIYARGEAGNEVYWIRRGAVRIFAPLGAGRMRHVASFGRGDFFGSLSFLDSHPRDNEAVALTDTTVYALSREQFLLLADDHKKLTLNLVTAMARSLALRLRHAESELIMLREY